MDADRPPGRPDAGGPPAKGPQGALARVASEAEAAAQPAPEPEAAAPVSFFTRLFSLGATERAELAPEEAGLSDGEREMLLNVRRLSELRVIDVMVPRADIESVELAADLPSVLEAFRHSHHSRLPVYRETLDDPVGFVHLKDIALRHGFGGEGGGAAEAFELRPLLRPILYVPPSMPVDALLQKMQGGRLHIALVIDEYGGVDGLVTIEDVLEQIVGEIEDEHDVADAVSFRPDGAGAWVAAARLEIPEFEEAAGVDLLSDDLDEEVDTLGGLVFMLADRVPERGEVIVHPDGHEFEVLDADPRRIKRLRVRLAAVDGAPRRQPASDLAGAQSAEGAEASAPAALPPAGPTPRPAEPARPAPPRAAE